MARFILAIVILAVAVGPVVSRAKAGENPLAAEAEQKKKEAEVVDKRYKSVLKSTDQAPAPVRTDPWQNMRGAADSKANR
jgi:hypothetical protein